MRISSSDGPRNAFRPALIALALAVLLVSAGCASMQGVSDPTTPAAGAASPTEPATAGPSESDAGSTTSASRETTVTGPSDPTSGPTVAGELTVVVAGDEVSEGRNVSVDRFRFDGDEAHTWHADGNVTLADALSTLDVEASDDAVTYDGETYADGSNGTSVSYRVNGDPVDPTEYTLAADDEIWVVVETADTNVSTPGEYIDEDDQHIHGHLEFTVDGRKLDFGRDRYQSNHRYFHFEGGEGASWHAHSYTLTLQYALSSLAGIEVTDDSVTFNGTTYDADDPDTTIRYEVNGEAVTPSEYYIKDWDGIRVVVERDG